MKEILKYDTLTGILKKIMVYFFNCCLYEKKNLFFVIKLYEFQSSIFLLENIK